MTRDEAKKGIQWTNSNDVDLVLTEKGLGREVLEFRKFKMRILLIVSLSGSVLGVVAHLLLRIATHQ